MAGMGPKLEDFLSGRYAGCEDASAAAETVYGSELKSVAAAGFLRGLPTEQLELQSAKEAAPPAESRKAVDSFGQRTSIYRGVTRHRWTGRYEAHLWDNSCRREGQSRKGRQGGYDKEEKAARAYDLAALKYWGPTTTTNFPISNYEKEMEEMKNMTRQEFVASLRRKSSGFSRGASIYRGVTRHHQHGRWQARIGRVAGNKDLYLGTFSTQEEAAEAYDIAAIKFRGLNAVTNFDMSRYDVNSIVNSNLPIGSLSAKSSSAKAAESPPPLTSSSTETTLSTNIKHQIEHHHDPSAYWSLLALPHHHHQQQQSGQASGFGLFSPAAAMDFPHKSQENGLLWNNGMQEQQQQQQQQEQQYATAMAFGPGFTCEASNYIGGWIAAPPPYYQQTSKRNVAALQTAIFGIE
ncbi:hypothetical protein Cni_G28537 [Canna indica]|uniref:AP2/ERF domain-containing protein n=1 Tax=Canna indica TaxID=4628 RepID=A0AAQ3L3J4_9LILI|nr:hypothetical protein Cni_G28537 [Canna indica]